MTGGGGWAARELGIRLYQLPTYLKLKRISNFDRISKVFYGNILDNEIETNKILEQKCFITNVFLTKILFKKQNQYFWIQQ